MNGNPLRIGYCLSLTGPLASNGKTARLAHEIIIAVPPDMREACRSVENDRIASGPAGQIHATMDFSSFPGARFSFRNSIR